jgi:hypothetical protein
MVLVLRRQKRKVLGCSRDNEVTYWSPARSAQ